MIKDTSDMMFGRRLHDHYCRGAGRAFAFYLASGLAGAVGRTGYLLAVTWTLTQQAQSANGVAVFMLIVAVTELLASALVGQLVDRFDRRIVCVLAESGRFLTLFATGLAFWLLSSPAVLLVSAALFAVFDRLSLTAYQAHLPSLSKPSGLIAANSAAFFVIQAGNLVSAVLTGVLLTRQGPAAALISLSLFSAISAFSVMFTRGCPAEPMVRRVTAPTRCGFVDRRLLLLGGQYALLYGSGVLVSVMAAPYILKELNGNALDFGTMEAFWSAGSIFGTLLPVLIRRFSRREGFHAIYLYLVAIALLCLPLAEAPAHLLIFSALGAFYNAGRVDIEANLHAGMVRAEQGRAKGVLHSLAMVVAIFIFLICANLDASIPATEVFATYGAVVMVLSFLLHSIVRRGYGSTRN